MDRMQGDEIRLSGHHVCIDIVVKGLSPVLYFSLCKF